MILNFQYCFRSAAPFDPNIKNLILQNTAEEADKSAKKMEQQLLVCTHIPSFFSLMNNDTNKPNQNNSLSILKTEKEMKLTSV